MGRKDDLGHSWRYSISFDKYDDLCEICGVSDTHDAASLPCQGKPYENPAKRLINNVSDRKAYPMARGCLDYFPDALAAVANASYLANEQHNPGEPIQWTRGKSGDHADALLRHLSQRGTLDKDGVLHSAKVAWRALALLQVELEAGPMVSFTDKIDID